MKMRVEMKNRSHRYDINITRSRHSYDYTKYNTYLNMMMVMCNSDAELKKKLCLKKHGTKTNDGMT